MEATAGPLHQFLFRASHLPCFLHPFCPDPNLQNMATLTRDFCRCTAPFSPSAVLLYVNSSFSFSPPFGWGDREGTGIILTICLLSWKQCLSHFAYPVIRCGKDLEIEHFQKLSEPGGLQRGICAPSPRAAKTLNRNCSFPAPCTQNSADVSKPFQRTSRDFTGVTHLHVSPTERRE